MPRLEYFTDLLKVEITQRREEGCDVAGFGGRLAQLSTLDQAQELYDQLMALTPVTSYVEPSDLKGIRAERPEGPRRLPVELSHDELSDRIRGGWLGRCAGCQLGRPVEGWPYERIRTYLERAKAYPLDGYVPEKSVDDEGNEWQTKSPGSTREHIQCAERDDDQDWTILALHILERLGPDFTTPQVGDVWLRMMPYRRIFVAARQAYRNLVIGHQYPECATLWNPYREWIGAQIRADGWGYAAPGWPERAAEFACRDAVLSHRKNGIYGEMFMAAAVAAAFVTEDMEEVVRLGLSEIPRNSRYAEMVNVVLAWSKECADWDSARARVSERYGHYHWVHSINNAALVLLALLYGRKDYEKTVCYAVMGGWDTDCNGATAGSILGVMLGASQLPLQWVSPLNDTIKSAVFGYDGSCISELAARTVQVARKVIAD